MKMVKKDEELANAIALMRFGLIAPIIHGTFTESSIISYCRRVTAEPIVRPDGSKFQFSPKTIEKWALDYKKGGFDALMPQSRSDKGAVKALSNECIQKIYNLKEQYPRLGGAMIHERLLAEGLLDSNVSVRTIQRFLKAQGLKRGVSAHTLTKERKAFEEPYFGAMWMADTCYFPHLAEKGKGKKRTYLMAIIDDHSRLVVGAQLFYADNAYNFQKLLKQAVATYGIPEKLYLDSGAPYRNAQLTQICAQIGTLLLHAPIRDGAAKAKVERLFGTIKMRWLYGLSTDAVTSLAEFNQELAVYIRTHNLTPNKSIQASPMERYLNSTKAPRAPQSEEWLDESFMNRVRRKVRNDATLSIDGRQFDTPQQFIRQTVEVRFLPDQMENAYIFDDKKRFPLKLTDKNANARVVRNVLTVDYSRKGTPDNV